MLGSHTLLIKKGSSLYVTTDGLRACKIFVNAQGDIWSNSYLAMCELAEPTLFDTQACFEYVTNGTVFGGNP